MWQYFAGAALLVYLLDILARRLPVRSRVRPS